MIKKIFLTIISIVSVVCIGLVGWYGYLHFFGEEKQTDQTFHISDMTVTNAVTGEKSTEVFCEVQVFKNAIEFNFNHFIDENSTAAYSTGIQLILSDKDKSIKDFDIFSGTFSKTLASDLVKDKEPYVGDNATVSSILFVKGELYHTVHNDILTNKIYDNFEFYEYSSFDDYKTTTNSTYLQEGNEFFHITMGDKVYGLSFKDFDKIAGTDHIDVEDLTNVGFFSETIETKPKWNVVCHEIKETNYYRALDLSYFIEAIGNSILSLPAGTNQELYYNVPNILNFYNYENGSYELINNTSDESVNLYANFSNFMKIKVKINDGELVSSKQSMFNTFAGNMNYGLDEDTSLIDYEAGRFMLSLDIDDLEFIATEESGVYKFKINEEIVDKYSEFVSVYVKVTIDLDELNIEYGGFEAPENSNFTIYKIIDGNGNNLLTSEVNYA